MPTDLHFEKKKHYEFISSYFSYHITFGENKVNEFIFLCFSNYIAFQKKIMSLFLYASRIIEEKL
jgi:hypothetical protein